MNTTGTQCAVEAGLSPAWQRVSKVLDTNDSGGAVKLPFLRDNDGLIFRLDLTGGTGDHALMPKKLCIPEACIKDILEVVHGEGHPGYQRCLQKASAWYIRNLARPYDCLSGKLLYEV